MSMTWQAGGDRRERHFSLPARTGDYVRDRRCPAGGYCFYRLDEPNAADTYCALLNLTLMGEENSDEETVLFLQGLQSPDGSFPSLSAALYTLGALRLLDAEALHDVSGYVLRSYPSVNPQTEVADSLSLFEPLYAWVLLAELTGVHVSRDGRDRIASGVLSFRSRDGGFGFPVPTLQDTRMAAEILSVLGYRDETRETLRFLDICQDPEFGFLGKPGSRPAFLEHLHAGLRLSRLLGAEPRHVDACNAFIRRCAHHSGGFARSIFGGAPTLEFTARAAESLSILAGFSIGRRNYAGMRPYL